jgi:hypothetical protein
LLDAVQALTQLLKLGQDPSGCHRSTSLDAVQAFTELRKSGRELLVIALHCRRHAIGRAARFFSCPLRRCAELFEFADEPVKPGVRTHRDRGAFDPDLCSALVRRRPTG